ncbi:MAG: hypothetical protein LBD31_05165 [Treponema sp.]|jgi:hypothetical protein|nr:hypothetical protein [Treponema sp.]
MNDRGPEDGEAAVEELAEIIRRRLESRYRRLCFVHQELAKLGASAKERINGTTQDGSPGAVFRSESFEDFVFSRIDFSIYKKIQAEEFGLLFDQGLEDFDEEFFRGAFNLDRKQTRRMIADSYVKAGSFFVCRRVGPLLWSIMRSLHTALDFLSLVDGLGLGEVQIRAAAEALSGRVIRHDDGMETRLFAPGQDAKSRGLLCGTFHPLGKAHTLTLVWGTPG